MTYPPHTASARSETDASERAQIDASAGPVAGAGLVSVVVPSYNHARFVERALRSVFAQTHAPAELVVIDDGSRDDSARVVERALKDCPFPCELVARENRGLSATLNEGLSRAARGRHFAYLGSDDLWLPDFLRARVHALEARPAAALAYGHCYYIDDEDRITDCTADWATYADGDARAMLWSGTGPHSPTVVYRRDAVARHGWREGARLEDYELYLRLAAEGEFAFDGRVLSAWRVHGGNASRDFTFMAGEWLDAQRRVARDTGVDEGAAARARRALGWACAENFARRGERARAARLALANLRGAPSLTATAKMLARLAAPRSVVERRARLRRAEAARRYGTLEELMRGGARG